MKQIKDNHWIDILGLFTTRDELFAPFRQFVAKRGEHDADKAMQIAAPDFTPPTVEDLIQARSEMRNALERLRNALSTDLGERDVYCILFPIVASLDEEVQTRYIDPIQLGPEAAATLAAFMEEHAAYAETIKLSSWPSFQRELFETDDAGEIFYETIDDLLLKPQTLPLIFETYYFCLNDGFRGRLVSNPDKKQEYMERLKDRIPQPSFAMEPLPMAMMEAQTLSFLETVPPYWLYWGAALTILGLFLILKGFGSLWNPLAS